MLYLSFIFRNDLFYSKARVLKTIVFRKDRFENYRFVFSSLKLSKLSFLSFKNDSFLERLFSKLSFSFQIFFIVKKTKWRSKLPIPTHDYTSRFSRYFTSYQIWLEHAQCVPKNIIIKINDDTSIKMYCSKLSWELSFCHKLKFSYPYIFAISLCSHFVFQTCIWSNRIYSYKNDMGLQR